MTNNKTTSGISSRVFTIMFLMVVAGFAAGLATNTPPERQGFFQRVGNWLGFAGLFFEPPPEEHMAEDCEIETPELQFYRSVPAEFANRPPVREVENGRPVIEHGSGW